MSQAPPSTNDSPIKPFGAKPFGERSFDLPYKAHVHRPMELFDPARHFSGSAPSHGGPSGADAPLPLAVAARANPKLTLIPREEDCHALWERYGMMEHIRAHSEKVAGMAVAIAALAREKGVDISLEAVLAAGLLHDLGKTYTIGHGGNHAQLGAAWVMRETRNGPVAQAVMFHVNWPWDENVNNDAVLLPFFILYADKRVMHDAYVSLDERFEDLMVRYGVNDYSRMRLGMSHQQGKRIETALSRRFGVDLNEYIADSGRLVKRT